MRRRKFITLFGGAVAAWPLAARAQRTQNSLTIGYLGQSTAAVEAHRLAAFVQRLRELGWVDGRNVAIDIRWTEGRSERAAEMAADFVRLKVDAIVTSGTPQTAIVRKATSVIPIIFHGWRSGWRGLGPQPGKTGRQRDWPLGSGNRSGGQANRIVA